MINLLVNTKIVIVDLCYKKKVVTVLNNIYFLCIEEMSEECTNADWAEGYLAFMRWQTDIVRHKNVIYVSSAI